MLIRILFLVTALAVSQSAFAQFTVDGQYFARGEYRNGFLKPITEGTKPALFVAHRARIEAAYQHKDFSFFMSAQDVRTWGSTSQLNVSDDFLSVHEAWAQVNFNPNWSLKLGRQELNYDNFRFLGNVDWAFQARSHDLALLKYEKEASKFHFGAAFNQQTQRLTGTTYEQPNQYKTAQFVRFEQISAGKGYSLLFWNEGREAAGKVNFKQTFGLSNLQFGTPKKVKTSSYLYFQTGENSSNQSVSAWNFGLDLKKEFVYDSARNSKVELASGFEILSGTASGDTQDRTYQPSYGTNHLFNGFMDYFYVSNTLAQPVGLQDLYLKGRVSPNLKTWIQADLHLFWTHKELSSDTEKFLGSELDLSFGRILNEAVSIQAGYSRFFAQDRFAALAAVINPKGNQDWAYLMFILRPNSKNRFIGVRI